MAALSTSSGAAEHRLNAIISLVSEEVVKLPPLRKMSFQQRKRFTIDLALIGLPLRTGYLVDVIAPEDAVAVFGRLIVGLRRTCSEFDAVAHIYESNTEQSFFVNVPMLLGQRNPDDQGYTHGVSFVHLGIDVPYSLVPNPPSDVTDALLSLVDDATIQPSLPPSITIRKRLQPETAVPLAAVLLEYPVAYIPASLKHPFLSNVSLDVYECTVEFEPNTPHSLVKFSCPSYLARSHPDVLAPSRIIASLTEKFGTRVRKMAPGTPLDVVHTTRTLDRVAL
ncbi:hypothetical protein LshimejAT787_0502050 [Lyophyllum shimeji]|uniref:Uncharacterized protein n=1 Tax=Lyophyllum shimeji TaxID=47721 RepID=A0A9P3PL58_LYOSH|nr:hypothetical protein LshimejAT787_0502050 [Lyophyllum shimeji]